MRAGIFISLTVAALLVAQVAHSDSHACSAERPYPRGVSACDRCPWEETLAAYQSGSLSTVRKSKIFNHVLRVSVVCDVGRPVDIEDLYEKIHATERVFESVLGKTIRKEDGIGVVLEVISGVCDVDDEMDDCVAYTVCREGGVGYGCDVSSGQSFMHSGGVATHAAIVPYLPKDTWWWIPSNRYANLQHEFSHILDYTYFKNYREREKDTNWWVEGLPQYMQSKVLKDQLSWDRGNDEAGLQEIFDHSSNTSDYYDGMRVFAFLDTYHPHLLDVLARQVQAGVYRDSSSHQVWQSLLQEIAKRHDSHYREVVTNGELFSRAIMSSP